MKRPPAVAGQFYYGTAERLTSQVEQYTSKEAVREKVIGAISPHAGLMYSGHVAGAVYSSISFPGTFVLLGPNQLYWPRHACRLHAAAGQRTACSRRADQRCA